MAPKVLLVDDELHILRAAEFKLKREGYDVICASDGEEAWERMRAARPDIVVTDYQMPRLNGLELVERLRQHTEFADLPVLMVTAKGYELSRNELGLDIVSKPFSPRELCRRVGAALEEAARRREPAGSQPE
jgi:two-component system alkaline phosphatase synthesis response regulator PhoP